MKYLIILFIVFTSCLTKRIVENKDCSFEQLMGSLPNQKEEINRILKKNKIDCTNLYMVPLFNAHLDTTPTDDLFISENFIQHLKFLDIDNPYGAFWCFKETSSDKFLQKSFDKILVSKDSLVIAETQLMYLNDVEYSFSVGFVGGPNVPTFIKNKNGLSLYYYDRERKSYIVSTIKDFISAHPEFIEKMPLPLLKLKELKK
jgi:hypothetical protein